MHRLVVSVFQRYTPLDIGIYGHFIPLADNLNFQLRSKSPTKTDQWRHTAVHKRRKVFQACDCLLKLLSAQGNVIPKFTEDPNHPSASENASSHSPCSPHPCFLSRILSVQEKRKREQANGTGRSDSLVSPSKAITVLLA